MSKRQFRLGDADRERLGYSDWVDSLEVASLTAREAALIQHQTPYRGPDQFQEALRGVPVTDADGNPVYEDEPGPDGKKVRAREPDYEATRVAMWLGLRRAGVKVTYADFDFALFPVEFRVEDDTEPTGLELEDPEGKGEGSTPPMTSDS